MLVTETDKGASRPNGDGVETECARPKGGAKEAPTHTSEWPDI